MSKDNADQLYMNKMYNKSLTKYTEIEEKIE